MVLEIILFKTLVRSQTSSQNKFSWHVSNKRLSPLMEHHRSTLHITIPNSVASYFLRISISTWFNIRWNPTTPNGYLFKLWLKIITFAGQLDLLTARIIHRPPGIHDLKFRITYHPHNEIFSNKQRCSSLHLKYVAQDAPQLSIYVWIWFC